MSGYTLVQGDCVESMRAMEAASVDAVVTDPPYGTENGTGYGRRQNYGGAGRTIIGDESLDALHAAMPGIVRVLRDNSWALFFVSPRQPQRHDASEIIRASGLELFGELVWDKGPGLGQNIRYAHETIVVARKGTPSPPHALISVLRHGISRATAANRHPHEKPVSLMRRLVFWACPEGGTVLDPFMGSGTTGVAAIQEGRNFIGCELSPAYIEMARKRIGNAPLSLFASIDGAA